jgi:Beta-galactosidase/beta-glucuronidase
VIHAESQVRNEDNQPRSFTFVAKVLDIDGREVARINGERMTMQPGETRVVKIQQAVEGLHFWSWGYGYLYTVKTGLMDDGGRMVDEVVTRTGFRKTRFAEGKIWLNDSCADDARLCPAHFERMARCGSVGACLVERLQ